MWFDCFDVSGFVFSIVGRQTDQIANGTGPHLVPFITYESLVLCNLHIGYSEP